MNNEQKLRAALIATLGLEGHDTLLALCELRSIVIGMSATAPDKETAQVTVAAVDVLIETHPDNEGVRRE